MITTMKTDDSDDDDDDDAMCGVLRHSGELEMCEGFIWCR
jgi:hypothetical protein